jgi:V/A-type H+-transporting ATPase subunit I
MSISTLSKVKIYFHHENKEKLIQRLQELACLHVVDFKETVTAKTHEELIINTEITDIELEKKINDLGFVIRCLSPFEKKSGFLNMLAGSKVLLSTEEYDSVLNSYDETDTVKVVRALEKEEHALLTEITNNEAMIRELEPWKSLDINLEEIKDTQRTCMRLGKVPLNKLTPLKDSLEKITDLYELHEVNALSESACILISYMKEFEDEVEDALTIYSFERKDFLKQSGRVSDIISSYLKKDEEDDKRLAEIAVELLAYAKELPKLKVKYDHLFNEYKKKRVEQNFGRTERVSLVDGYVDSEDLPKLKELIESEFEFAELEEVEISKDEKIPTKLKNKSASTQSFELVLDLYGMPANRSFDSTRFLMPFFAVFFGLCLTDGGYGILLVLFSAFMIKKYRPIFGSSKLMRMLLICGIATIGAGAITGGWFGDIIDKLPDSMSGLKSAKNSMKLFDPMEQTMVFFMLSLALGYTHIMFGLTMGFIKHVKDGELKEGLCTKMTWIVFLGSLLLWVLALQGVIPAGLTAPSKFILILAAVSIVLFSETGAKSIGIKIASGLYNLYGASSYVGDLLSYLRLLALGLASGVIAVVINQMCALAMEIPYAGMVIAAIVFVGGHIFNMVLSGLGAFVHTLRLNYVEFFPKFFVGGGKMFKPFKMEPSYMIFNDEEGGNS